MGLAPIALFCFNRPEHLKKTVEALCKNAEASQTKLYVFSDGPRTESDDNAIEQIRRFIPSIQGFASVDLIAQPKNLGLAESIITGVTKITQEHGRVIVVEDDLITSPYFLKFMNDGLRVYENDSKVASIHGYMYPIKAIAPETFFIRGGDCWGWATWARAWQYMERDSSKLLDEIYKSKLEADFDFNGAHSNTGMLKNQTEGKVNSWAIRWHAATYLQDMLTLYPGKSLVHNIGYDSSGTHCGVSENYDVPISREPIKVERIPLKEDLKMKASIEEFFWMNDHGKTMPKIPSNMTTAEQWSTSSDNKVSRIKLWLTHLSLKVRNKQFGIFNQLTQFDKNSKVLDVGFSPYDESVDVNFFERYYPYPENVVAASVENCEHLKEKYNKIKIVKVEADKPLPYADGAFDAVTAWATLEHVGTRKQQEFFLNECLRVGKKVFLTTPDRACFYEPHSGIFFLHWLPLRVFRKICKALGKTFWADERNLNSLLKSDILNMKLRRKIVVRRFKMMGILPSHLIISDT